MAEYDITGQITAALREYSLDVLDGVEKAAERCAKGLAKDLRKTSPARTGEYRKGWTSKKQESRSGTKGATFVAYNKDHYQLTHLLEKPHARPYHRGPDVPPQPHIKPAETKWQEQFLEDCEGVVKG